MALQDPNLGLNYGWTLGENGWNTGMDANIKRLGALLHLSVASRALTTPPATPAEGDRYLIPAAATGDWAGKTGQIALWIGAAWAYYIPAIGWRCWVEDEAALLVYTAGAWTAAVASSGGGSAPSATDSGLVIIAKDLIANGPTGDETIGDVSIVGAYPVAEWAGHPNQIATLTAGGWTFKSPASGQLAYIDSSSGLFVYRWNGWTQIV